MESIEDLITPLRKATEDGTLNWEQDGPSGYKASLPSYQINLWSGTDSDTGFDFVSAQLLDKEKRVLDFVNADEFSSNHNSLYRLLLTARRSALNLHDFVSDVQRELRSLKKGRKDDT